MSSRHTKQKQIAYAEGLCHGFGMARDIIEKITDGSLTLNEPDSIKEWMRREARLREELRVSDNVERITADKPSPEHKKSD